MKGALDTPSDEARGCRWEGEERRGSWERALGRGGCKRRTPRRCRGGPSTGRTRRGPSPRTPPARARRRRATGPARCGRGGRRRAARRAPGGPRPPRRPEPRPRQPQGTACGTGRADQSGALSPLADERKACRKESVYGGERGGRSGRGGGGGKEVGLSERGGERGRRSPRPPAGRCGGGSRRGPRAPPRRPRRRARRRRSAPAGRRGVAAVLFFCLDRTCETHVVVGLRLLIPREDASGGREERGETSRTWVRMTVGRSWASRSRSTR